MKKLISILFCLFFSYTIKLQPPRPPLDLPPPPENIDELLKDFDFEKMLEELEKVFGPVEDQDLKPPEKPKEKEKKIDEKEILPEKFPAKKTSQKEKFIDSAKSETDKPVKKLDPEKLKALYFYMDRFIELIENLESNINSFNLGIAYKEKLENLKPSAQQIFTKIKIENGKLFSRKLYPKVFFLESFKDTRKEIIESIEKLEKINPQLQKISRQQDEEEIIELLEEFEKQKDIEKLKQNLKHDINNLLTKNLNSIGKKLEKITVSAQAKEIIEEKKKKIAQKEKEAEEKRKRTMPHYPRTWSPSGPRPWSGPPDNYKPFNRYERTLPMPSRIEPFKKDFEQKRDHKPKTEDQTQPEFTTMPSSDKKNKIKKIENATNKSLELLKKIMSVYKPNNENSYKDILNTSLLSNLSEKMNEIEKLETELLQEQKKELEKMDTYKNKELQQSLSNFIPAAIRLAKIPTRKTDQQKAALNIINQHIASKKELNEKLTKELSEYETTILNKITVEPLRQYDPGVGLDNLLKNIKIIFAQPMAQEDQIQEQITQKQLLETTQNMRGKKSYLIENTQLPALKQSIINSTLERISAIDTRMENWTVPTAWKIKIFQKITSNYQSTTVINQQTPEQREIREKIALRIENHINRLTSEISKYNKINSILTAELAT
ncbi:hypothetical protein GF322_00835 [Candidatus Dependentiae bacterium]|nr:hypothetical protein [Candidatus Dependentiae bacterium]